MYQRVLGILLVLLGGTLATADAAADQEVIGVSGAYVRALPPGQTTGAAFLSIDNHTDSALVLSGIRSDAATRVEIHTHLHDGEMMRMRQLPSVAIGAGERTTFAPGGLHLMLIGLTRPLAAGDQINLVLQFANGVEMSIEVPVVSLQKEPS